MTKKETSMRRLVKYKNQLNEVALHDFNPNEMDLFFMIAAQVRDKGVEEVTMDFSQVRAQIDYQRSNDRLVSDLTSTYSKLLRLGAISDDGRKVRAFNLFSMFEIDRNEQTVTIAINRQFKSLFNNLEQWTVFGLEEFVALHSVYSKTMYRLVKQFRTTGYRRFLVDDFRHLLDIPDSYTSYQIQTRVVDVINQELPPLISGFELKILRRAQLQHPNRPAPKRGRGAQIAVFEATWDPEHAKPKLEQRKDVTPNKQRQKRKETLPDWAYGSYQSSATDAANVSQSSKRIEALLDELKTDSE